MIGILAVNQTGEKESALLFAYNDNTSDYEKLLEKYNLVSI